ncbi:MAG TPA: tripartite tricarboxylate transporter substrate binding protein [Burkholderiales bacterium]|nr:tripartite tricarboxylate transporter substrate binding protein [Burkholderiales bacterium]
MRLAACAAALAACAFAPAQAQTHSPAWPDRPIKLIVSFAPGGVHDTLARVLQPQLTEALGQPIVIENRPGAGGNIAAEAVAKSAPDGYTFLIASEAIATNEYLYRSMAYDPYKDLAPVAKLADYPMALIVNPAVPAANVKELIALARAKPGSLSYGSAGIGTSGHLAGELLNSVEGISIVHVPYKGGAPALADLVAGRIQFMFLSVSLSAPQLKQGKIRVLAVTGDSRSGKLPGVSTTAEQGFPGVQALLFSSLLAPAATPPAIIRRMNAETVKALRTPEVVARLTDLGAVPAPSSPEQFAGILKRDGDRWGRLIREKNIHAN